MWHREEYRNKAFDSLRLAERTGAASDKLRMLAVAEAWMSLADHAADWTRGFGEWPNAATQAPGANALPILKSTERHAGRTLKPRG